MNLQVRLRQLVAARGRKLVIVRIRSPGILLSLMFDAGGVRVFKLGFANRRELATPGETASILPAALVSLICGLRGAEKLPRFEVASSIVRSSHEM